MKTITVTEAKRGLGHYLRQAAAGEKIGIVSGADIISLRKVEVTAIEGTAPSARRAKEAGWPDLPSFDGGPIDGALRHDQ